MTGRFTSQRPVSVSGIFHNNDCDGDGDGSSNDIDAVGNDINMTLSGGESKWKCLTSKNSRYKDIKLSRPFHLHNGNPHYQYEFIFVIKRPLILYVYYQITYPTSCNSSPTCTTFCIPMYALTPTTVFFHLRHTIHKRHILRNLIA